MTTEIEPTSPTGPTAPAPRKPGRPKKIDPLEVIAELQRQVAALQSAALATQEALRNAPQAQAATLDLIPAASPALPPGTYVKIGQDGHGSPIMGKVHWTKSDIEATYVPVTFTPMREMTVGPHGVLFRVEAGKETTVPCIVKDFYDAVIKAEDIQRAYTRPMSAIERAELDARAMESPGRHMSRLARVGYGLSVQTSDSAGVETPTT